jgi:hypothetical protein
MVAGHLVRKTTFQKWFAIEVCNFHDNIFRPFTFWMIIGYPHVSLGATFEIYVCVLTFGVYSGSYVIMTGAIGGAGWYMYRLSTRPDGTYLRFLYIG